jgi:hypothetical protein
VQPRLSLAHLTDEDPDQPEPSRDDDHEAVEQKIEEPVTLAVLLDDENHNAS